MSHHKKPVQPLPPRDKLFLTAGNLEDPKHKAVLNRAVDRQPVLSHIDLTFSTTSAISELPSEIKDLIEQYTFSHARMDAAELLTPSIMNSYIRGKTPGSLVLISSSDSVEDVLAIDGNSHLVLSLCKDTHSIFGTPGYSSQFGPKLDRYCVEIDLLPDYMRAGKPGFERIRTGLHKLGDKDFLATYIDEAGKPAKVEFPSSGTSKAILKPRISCTHSKIGSSSELVELQDKLSNHDFRSSKTLKRKRNVIHDEAESGILVQDLLEAIASVDLTSSSTAPRGDMNVLSVSIDGLLHPLLARQLLDYFTASKDHHLISMTASTMSHSPVHCAIKRQKGRKSNIRGTEERAVNSGILDGWSILFGTPKDGKTRFVFMNSPST